MTTEIPKRIASDIDDVLLNLKDPLRDYYNRRFGANLQLSHYNNYALDKVWGCTRQEAVQIVDDFYLSPEFKTMQPVQGAMEATSLISLRHEISAITSRPISMQEQTTGSLMQYFGNIFSEIFHNGQYGLQTSGLDKSGYCLSCGISTILEDNLDISIKCAEKGIQVILFNYLWNRTSHLPRGIIRVGEKENHWQGATEILLQ